jgi:hypothetical protein
VTAQHHYRACIRAWARHVDTCPCCKSAIEQHGNRAMLCESGAAAHEELRIAAQRIVEQLTTARRAA